MKKKKNYKLTFYNTGKTAIGKSKSNIHHSGV